MERLRALAPYAHWLLRLALASVFLYHGITKFPALEGISEMMGMPVFVVGMLAAAEVAAALLILAGGFSKALLTRIGGAIIAVVMLGAIFMVHLQNGWNSVNMGSGNMGQGMEFQFTLLMIGLYFVVVGNGTQADVGVDTARRTSAAHPA
ncbi:MAG: DoxX family protein [Rhodothermales bacterium]